MTVEGSSGWTVETLFIHFNALRAADQRAVSIKETGDRDALQLAREIQTYKDEKANELREQINSERNLYPTKRELYGYLIAAAGFGAAMATIVRAIT